MNIRAWKGFVVVGLFKELLHFPGKEVVKAETQGKVIWLDQREQPMKSAPFFPQRSFCCQASSPWSWETPGPSVQLFRDLLFNSGVLFCGISSQSYLFAGTSAWRSAQTKYCLSKESLTHARSWAEWGEGRTKNIFHSSGLYPASPLPSFLRAHFRIVTPRGTWMNILLLVPLTPGVQKSQAKLLKITRSG